MFLCDFHIHSRNSDGRLSIEELVDYYGQRGFGAIAITDHLCETNTFLGRSARFLEKTLLQKNFSRYMGEIHQAQKLALRRYDMVVIPGVEFTKNSFSHSDSAHILGLGLTHFIDPNLSVDDLILAIHQQKGLAIAAHPVSTRKIEPQTYHLWHQRDRLSLKMDAWEVASGAVLFNEVFDSGLPMIANSDLHHPSQMSSWKTVLDCKKSLLSILCAIKHQNLNFTYYQNPQAWETMQAKSPNFVTNAQALWV